jgi:hypothetical protein
MHGACYIVAPNGVLDPLPAATDPREVFDQVRQGSVQATRLVHTLPLTPSSPLLQGPLHRIQLKNGWNLLWTSAGYHLAEVGAVFAAI